MFKPNRSNVKKTFDQIKTTVAELGPSQPQIVLIPFNPATNGQKVAKGQKVGFPTYPILRK